MVYFDRRKAVHFLAASAPIFNDSDSPHCGSKRTVVTRGDCYITINNYYLETDHEKILHISVVHRVFSTERDENSCELPQGDRATVLLSFDR